MKREQVQEVAAPASDRIVGLDHNSLPISQLQAQIKAMEDTLSRSNSLKSEAGYERILAEIGAASRLLDAPEVRISVFERLIVPALKWIGVRTAAAALGLLVTSVATLLASIFGISIPGVG